MSATITYQGNTIVSLTDDGTKTLKTGGTYCEADITVAHVQEKKAVSWHQCPAAVRSFLEDVTYDPADYTVSRIAAYAPAAATVETKALYTRPIGETADGVTYYNPVPNRATPFASEHQAGTLTPLDRLRWIRGSSTLFNCRDLGGWSCDGGTVKYGLLFRGNNNEAGDRAALVGDCGVRRELDLRGSDDTRSASPLGTDIRYLRYPSQTWYSLANKAAWKANLRFLFDGVANNEPVYFHCSAGADRTGTLACILEALLGVSQSDLDKDYELTCFSTGTDSAANARRRNEADWMGLIAELNAKSGASLRDKAVNFAAELGFTAAEINAFRAAMIDGTPETVTPSIAAYTITGSLSHSSLDNTALSIAQYQDFTAVLTPDAGYYIKRVTVTVNGTDVTGQVFSGSFVPNGSLSITENGEADVRSYETVTVNVPSVPGVTAEPLSVSANGTYTAPAGTAYSPVLVNVPVSGSTNTKEFTVTLSGQAQSGAWCRFTNADPDLAAHRTDGNMFVTIQGETVFASAAGLYLSCCGNRQYGNSANAAFGIMIRSSASAIGQGWNTKNLTSQSAAGGQIFIDTDGSVSMYPPGSYPILAGTYHVICSW